MAQRTQLHIKKNGQFYVIHNQWGLGKYMLLDVCMLTRCGIFNDNLNAKEFSNQLSKHFKKEGGSYYSVEQGVNNNGFCLIDCDAKTYGFVLGREELIFACGPVPVSELTVLSGASYLLAFPHDIMSIEIAENLDNLFKKEGYCLFVNERTKTEKSLLNNFLEESNQFSREKNNKNAYDAVSLGGALKVKTKTK